MYAISGVTGQTGSAAAERVLERGEKLRVIVRDAAKGKSWAERGAEVAVASLSDAESLRRAIDGSDGAYLLLAPGAEAEDFVTAARTMSDAITAALKQTQTPAVLLSSIGAQHERGTGPIAGLHALERATQGRDCVTYLRAAYFVENWAGVLPIAIMDGALPSILPLGVPIEMVSTRDIGATAADLLIDGSSERVVELAGPRAYAPEDIAEAAASVLGRSVVPTAVPPDHVADALQAGGVGRSLALLYQEMIAGAARGLLAFEGASPRRGSETPLDVIRRLRRP